MGEPVRNIETEDIDHSLNMLREAEKEFRENISDIEEFQDKTRELKDSVSDSSVKSGQNVIQNNLNIEGVPTGDDILELYDEVLVDEKDKELDEIRKIEYALGLSTTAAHLFHQTTRNQKISKDDVAKYTNYLDQNSPLSASQVNQAIVYTESMIKVRENTFDDIDVERSSLKYFESRIEEVKERITDTNQENTFPMDFNQLYSFTSEIDDAYLELENLKQLRKMERKYLEKDRGTEYLINMERITEIEDGDPVINEIEKIQQTIEQTAVDGINYPLHLRE